MKLIWNFLGEGSGCKRKILLWGEYEYFLELHILCLYYPFNVQNLEFGISNPLEVNVKYCLVSLMTNQHLRCWHDKLVSPLISECVDRTQTVKEALHFYRYLIMILLHHMVVCEEQE